jgi:signal transduction histidine kinase
MTVRWRIALVLAASLAAIGGTTLVANALAFRHTAYPTWTAYRTALLDELDIKDETVAETLRKYPELFFQDQRGTVSPGPGMTVDQAASAVQRRAADATLRRARQWTLGGLAAVAIVAVLAGWYLAGRILRPVRLITARARAASAGDLEGRLSLTGPNDELRLLGDTFDEMLERLESAFDAQRRFSRQVAHELRTPLATTASEVQMLLADIEDRAVIDRLDAISEATSRADRLVAQLLVLSRTDHGDLDRTTFDLAELVGNVVGRAVESEPWSTIRLDLDLRTAPVTGDRALLEVLVRNLVENAGRHNRAGGWADVSVGSTGSGDASLRVANSVPAAGQVPPMSHGVGLTIVDAVAEAHGSALIWRQDADHTSVELVLPAAVVPASV